MIEKYNIFSTPLFITKYVDTDLEKIKEEMYEIERKDKSPYKYCEGSYSSFSKEKHTQFLELDSCKDLKKFIDNIIANINIKLGIPNRFRLKESWFTINRQYSYHGVHNHNPALWSGVFYLHADDTASAITFINENLKTNWPYLGMIQDPSEYTSTGSTFQVKTHDLIIFPGWLPHKMEFHNADTERITIAFNYTNFF